MFENPAQVQAFATAFAFALSQASNPDAQRTKEAWGNLYGQDVAAALKAVSSSPSYTYGHGPGGLFSTPGLDAPIFSAMQLPVTGLQNRLPVKGTNVMNPMYGLVTGVTASAGSEPVGVCDDPPVAGLMEFCTQTAIFGRFSRMSPVLDIDRIGKIINRAENMSLQLMNTPTWPGLAPTMPTQNGAAQALKNEVAKLMFEFGVAWSRDFARKIYTGNPTNNTAAGGYKEYNGLDILINTGKHDAVTGNLCPAADSLVVDFASANISGAANAANAELLVRNMIYLYRVERFLSRRANLDPVKWAWVMPESLFYEVTQIWPCVYNTYQCATVVTDANVQVVQNGADSVAMRDQMRQGKYLLIDGEKVEVIEDDAVIPASAGGGVYTSSVYLVPLTVLGSTPVTYFEYYDYAMNGASIEAANLLAPSGTYYASDNGRFLWHKKAPTNFCIQFLAKTEPRLRLDTPFIAARIININFQPLMLPRSPWPGDPNYVDGGQTTYPSYAAGYVTP